MKKITIIIAVVFGFALSSSANDSIASNRNGMEYKVAAGFNIGGTSPIGLPAEVRGINSYKPTPNLSIAGYAIKMFNPTWGLKAGLRFENKGMETGINVKELAVDGGASSNNLLLDFQANILGKPVERPECIESTALGAAYLAGLATGYYSSLDEIKKNRKEENMSRENQRRRNCKNSCKMDWDTCCKTYGKRKK